jgi:hypothetical protein
MRKAVALLALFAAVLTGAARAEDNPACARFDDPLAYNACLASHGPKAKGVAMTPEPTGAREPEGRPYVAPKHVSNLPNMVRRRGRIHMEFMIR